MTSYPPMQAAVFLGLETVECLKSIMEALTLMQPTVEVVSAMMEMLKLSAGTCIQ